MSEKHIPPDIMDKAQAAWDEAVNQPTDTRAEVTIALAILTERERASMLLSKFRQSGLDNEELDQLQALIQSGAAA